MFRILMTFATLLIASTASADDWPQWRGPTRDCQVDAEQWPNSLDEQHLTRAWRVPMGPSYSGPIVFGNRVFVTETRNKSHEIVRALDRQTGKELWKTEWEGAMTVPFFAKANGSWIRSTPACDGQHLYVSGIRDVLVCLNAATGDEVWRIDFVKKFGSTLPSFGAVSSPLLEGDCVIIQAGASVVKLRRKDGSVVWRTGPESGGIFGQGMGGSAFSSAIVTTLGGKRQVVVQTRSALAGLDLESGATLWSVAVPAFRGMNILTPLVKDDAVFTSSYGGGSFLFDVKSSGGKLKAEQRWKTNKEAYMSSPALIGDNVYVHLRNQRFSCVDHATGATKWTTKTFGKYWSMVVNGSKVLALDQTGELRLIDANPAAYEEVSRRKVSESSAWAHLAVAGNQLFVRELDAISGWNWK